MKKIIGIACIAAVAACAFFLYPRNAVSRAEKAGQPAITHTEKNEPGDEYIRRELEMMRDPVTGRIPADIRERETEFKMQLIADHASQRTPDANSYVFVGPENMGGRTRAIAYDKRDDNIVLAGGVSGGVFRSTDGGKTWTRVSSLTEPADVTSIVQDPRAGHEDKWYYSTGNGGRGNSASFDGSMGNETAYYLGCGVYISIDNGISWFKITGTNETGVLGSFDKHMDLITRLAIHPTTGDIYAAASGAIYRGVYSFNWITGFTWTWSNVLGNGMYNYYALTDVAIAPNGTVYAGISGVVTGGFDGVWKSANGNPGSWTRIAGGVSPAGWKTQGNYGRVVLAIPPSNQNVLWVAYYNSAIKNGPTPNADLFKYTYNPANGISSWANKSSLVPSWFETYTGYALSLAVKPNNSNHVYLAGLNLVRIIDGAQPQVESFYHPHPDIHVIGFKPVLPNKPANVDTMFTGSDGGVYRAFIPTAYPAGSISWTNMNKGYGTFQYYYSSINQDPNAVVQYAGGAQDNGTTAYKTTSAAYDHLTLSGGDGFQCFQDNAISYTSSQWGELNRVYANGGVSNFDPSTAGADPFVTYFHMNPVQGGELMFYSDEYYLFRTTTASTATSGSGWTELTGTEFWYPHGDLFASDEITAMATTNQANATLFIGTMHGTLARLSNAETCAPSTIPTKLNIPAYGAVSWICVDPSNSNNVMFTLANYSTTSVYYSTNALAATPTWTAVEGNLTLPSFRTCAIVNGPLGKEYYVGTTSGLFRTTLLNGAATVWTQESAGLIGNAVVTSLSYRPSDFKMLIGTHGNGMYLATLGEGGKAVESALHPNTPELSVFPNPVRRGNTINLRYNATHAETSAIELYDLNGRKVWQEPVELKEGENLLTSQPDLVPGIYLVRIGIKSTQLVIAN